MKLPEFEYRAPETVDAALHMLAALGSDAKVLAGGQSLLPTMRYGLARPAVLLDVKRVPLLRGVRAENGGLSIGAMTTHADLAQSVAAIRDVIPAASNPWSRPVTSGATDAIGRPHTPDTPHATHKPQDPSPIAALLAAHAAQIAFPAVRTRGTVGGSLVHADPAGDWPLLFSALDARVELRSLRGRRDAALSEFILGPLTTDIEIDELLTAVIVDADNAGLTAWGRAKLMHRAGEYATASAIALRRASGRWSCWIAAGAAGPRPMPGCAALLEAGRAGADTLLDRAREETARVLPDEPAVAIHRHAVNLIRAIAHAREGNRHD